MSSPRLIVPPTLLQTPMVDTSGRLNFTWQKWFQGIQQAQQTVTKSFDQAGSFQGTIGQQAALTVRGIAIATLLANIDDTGILTAAGIDFSRVYTNQNINYIADGTGSPIAGGKTAYAALVASAPLNGQVLEFNGTNWVPVTLAAGGVTQIIAGTNVTLSPPGGTGAVTVNASYGGAGTPTAAVGPAAGIAGVYTPGAALASGSTDTRGQIQITTGAATTTGILATITLSAALGATPTVLISPANGAAIMDGTTPAQVSAQGISTTQWTLTADPNATQVNVSYMAWNYLVVA